MDDEQPGAAAAAESWHAMPAEAVALRLRTRPDAGLEGAEAERRLARHGPNRIGDRERSHWVAVLGRQFADVLVAILLVAAALSALIGETLDAAAILAVVVLNGALGFAQEWRAERAIRALSQLLAPRALALRDGRALSLDAEGLVPGDVVLLEAGARVPADLRLIQALDLRADESALTGESAAVRKQTHPVSPAAPLADRFGMAWMGTCIRTGRARGIVVATGASTEFGRIAALAGSVERGRTPLQEQLAGLGHQLGIVSLVVAALVAAGGWSLGQRAFDMFLTGVSLAVAIVPEGLPAVVTLTLTIGIRAMARRRALLRRLAAAETLGKATVICTDKTGTLTCNEMTAQRIWLDAGEIEITGVGYEPVGGFTAAGRTLDPGRRPDLLALLATAARCHHCELGVEDGRWVARGDPTEAALLVAARKAQLEIPAESGALHELPFAAERKRMTTVWPEGAGRVAHVKGAPEILLPRCSRVLDGARERPLEARDREAAIEAWQRLAAEGLRTLAVARRTLPDPVMLDADAIENDLTLLGIVGILDPPRPEVPAAISAAHAAGIRVVMITGDAAPTARAVAQRIGLRVERVLDGPEVDAADDAALEALLGRDVVFARTTPEHKLRIVEALQRLGHVAAMTGDGVNDAPALERADVGIAMGVRGTDVARAAADMVLTDDNFASIVGAVEEGRRQHDNIRKFVGLLLSSNLAEIVAIVGGLAAGGGLILLPSQILWVNLVTDGLTSVALGAEPAEADSMRRPPRGRGEALVGPLHFAVLLGMGLYLGLAALWLFQRHAGDAGSGGEGARTAAFTALIVLETANALNFRGLHQPLWRLGWLANPWLLAAMAGTLALQVLVVYAPPFQHLLHLAPLDPAVWIRIAAAALPLVLACEAWKHWRWARREGRGAQAAPRSAEDARRSARR